MVDGKQSHKGHHNGACGKGYHFFFFFFFFFFFEI
jgi:hypothetical protein